MRSTLAILLLCLLHTNAFAQLEEEHKQVVIDFIDLVKRRDVVGVARLAEYGLSRQYPLPAIKDSAEFVLRYKEVFDDSLVKMIVNSDIAKDWDAVGWRGIMLNTGQVWLDYDGSLLAITYQTPAERKQRDELIKKERASLHASISQIKAPIYILTTSKYRIRIDELADGSTRYASWPINAKVGDKPELVIQNGEYIWEGSGGNHTYRFVNNGYTYECSIIVMGAKNEVPAMLTVTKSDKQILSQKAQLKGR